MKKLHRFYNWLPFLHLVIELPFFSVRTGIMVYCIDGDTLAFSVFKIRLFRWRFEFSLIQPDEERF